MIPEYGGVVMKQVNNNNLISYIERAIDRKNIINFCTSSKFTNKEKESILEAIWLTKIEMEKTRSHRKDSVAVDPFNLFKANFKKAKLNRKEFDILFNSFFEVSLKEDIEYNKHIIAAVNLICALTFSHEDVERIIVSFVFSLDYVFQVVKGLCQTYPSLQVNIVCQVVNNAYLQCLKSKKVMNESVLEMLAYYSDIVGDPDSLVENNLILYNLILNSFSKEKNILLIFPTVKLVMSVLSKFQGDATFIVKNEVFPVFSMLESKMSNIHFLKMDDYLNSFNYHSVFEHVFVFEQRIEGPNAKLNVISKAYESITERGQISIFDSDYAVEQTIKSFAVQFNVNLRSIVLLPSGVRNHKNQVSSRRTLVTLCLPSVDTVSVEKYIYKEQKNNSASLLKSPFNLEINQNDYMQIKSIRHGMREHINQELMLSSRHLKHAIEFKVSSEITVFATVSKASENSKYRVEAYYRNSKGEKVKDTIKRKQFDDYLKIRSWIENEYPFEKVLTHNGEIFDIRSIISSEFKERELTSNVTLKTLYYLLANIESLYSSDDILKIRGLLFGTYLGDLSIGELTVEVLDAFFEKYQIKNDEQVLVLKLISELLEETKTVFNFNFKLDIVAQEFQVKFDGLRKIRLSLLKSHLNNEELKSFLKLVETEIKEGETQSMAVLIQVFTGLESNAVAALKWRDFEIRDTGISGKPLYLMHIRRLLRNNGKEYMYFDIEERHRIIPIVDFLAEILTFLKQSLVEKVGLNDEVLEMPIIIGATKVSNYKNTVCAPYVISAKARQLVKQLNIPALEIEVPTKDDDKVETNLNDYKGNILRTNFEYWISRMCQIELGAIEFLMGRQASTTLSKHYLDYSNTETLIRLQGEINRLPYLLKNNESKPHSLIMCKTKQFKGESETLNHVRFLLKYYDGLSLIVKNDYGLKIEVLEVNSNEEFS